MEATDELYFKYARVIEKAVARYSVQFPELTDDLYLQAGLVFCEACKSYDSDHPSRASFGTWLAECLQSLSEIITKACHGPNLCIHGGPAPVRSYTIDGETEDCCDPSAGAFAAALSTGIVDEYSSSLGIDGEYPPEMRPYLELLQGDALQIFRDFGNNLFYVKPDTSKTRAYNKAHNYLTPKKIYMRRYLKLGWSWKRTCRAFETLKSALKLYTQDKLPCLLIPAHAEAL